MHVHDQRRGRDLGPSRWPRYSMGKRCAVCGSINSAPCSDDFISATCQGAEIPWSGCISGIGAKEHPKVAVGMSNDATDGHCFRGLLQGVAKRATDAFDAVGAETLVRILGDSPLLDPRIVVHAVELFGCSRLEVVTNVFPRTFHHGQSVGVARRSRLTPPTTGVLALSKGTLPQ